MTIAIDIDDVLYPFCNQFHYFSEGYLDKQLPEIINWTFSDDWEISKSKLSELFTEFISEGGYERGTPISGARIYLRELYKKHDIILATTRGCGHMPIASRARVIESTAKWLDFYRVPYHHLLFTGNKGLIKADILLDDNLDNLAAFEIQNEGGAIAFKKPWNESWYQSVSSWKDFSEWVEQWR